MPTVVWIIIAAVVIIAAVIFFLRRGDTPQLEQDKPPELKPGRRAEKPAKKPRPKPEAVSPPPAPVRKEAVEEQEVAVSEAPPEEEPAEAAPKPTPVPFLRRDKDVKGLRKGLKKVRASEGLFGRLKKLFTGKKEIDPELVDEMEEILLTSDVGVSTTKLLLDDIREMLDKNELDEPDKVWGALRERATALLNVGGEGALRDHGKPTVVLIVGVNGTGKTTTIGKLATSLVEQEKSVLLVAGDTFRAAAVAQLQAWGKRVSCDVFAGKDGADPASVVFDAVTHGVEQSVDVILVDTAGRLHTKANLMDELEKMMRSCGKALDGAPHETLLVVDGTTGQNAIQQAQEFGEALDLTGIVLTKLDGTAKGGVVLAIAHEHGLPVRYIGVGERARDLRDFDADEFVEAMLGGADDAAQAA